MLDSLHVAGAPAVSRAPQSDWRDSYARRLAVTDTLSVVWAVMGAHLISFGLDAQTVSPGDVGSLAINYAAISIFISIAWIVALHVVGSRDHRVVGTEFTEYRRVISASVQLFGLLAIAAFLLKLDIARGYFIAALPLGLLVLLASRWMWRQWLRVKRSTGQFAYQVLLVGSEATVVHLARELQRHPAAGYHIVGACVPNSSLGSILPGTNIQLWANLDDLMSIVSDSGADTVALTSSDELPPARVRELSWSLEPGRQHLVVAPSLTDIAGPRIHTRPVSGLPLIHVETPRYEGPRLYSKRIFDLVVSSLLILVLSPVLLVVALGIKITSPGPVFFSQPRVGRNGNEFRMLKFRSMVIDAEARLAALREQERDRGNEILFKMKDDPRITKIGKVIRRYSLDELPQLLNVWLGSMSLVGPRPPLFREVEQYEWKVNRRFLVKPGITGLWQVSGRSDLSWEESVRLDLYYVENWSMTGDLLILWRTARAVLGSSGAY